MNIYNKIIKSFSQQVSSEDQAQIEAWKKESEDNLKVIKELQLIHQNAEKLKDFQPVDKSAAWSKIKEEAKLDDAPVYKLPFWVKSSAAAIILLVAAVFLFKPQNNLPLANETLVSNNEITEHDLPDGTVVMLDKNSSLELIENRYVALDGRANFNVTTTPSKNNFTIKLNGGKITVLGTQFSVLSTNDLLEISVTEGHVRLDYKGRSMDLYKNDLVRLYNDQLAVTKNNYTNTNGWIEKELIFKDEPISNVLADLSRYFKKKIVLDKSLTKDSDCLLTSKYSNPTIEEILDELRTIFKAKIINQANSYVIVSINCDN